MADYRAQTVRRIRSINARITTVGRIYGTDSDIYKRLVHTIQRAGGGTRFSIKMFEGGLRELSKAENALRIIEASQYTTAAGRRAIGEKARETFQLNHAANDSEVTKMFDVFKNSSFFSRIKELYHGQSDIVVDEIMDAFESDKRLSGKKVAKAIDSVLSGDNVPTNLSDFLEEMRTKL